MVFMVLYLAKSPKNSFSPFGGGPAYSDRGYSPLVLPWYHPCLQLGKYVKIRLNYLNCGPIYFLKAFYASDTRKTLQSC